MPPRIKPLKWITGGPSGTRAHAAAFGLEAFYRVTGEQGPWSLLRPAGPCRIHIDGPFETQAAARFAAEEDYRHRVIDCLAPEGGRDHG